MTDRTYALRDGDAWWYFVPQVRWPHPDRVTDQLGNDLEPGTRTGWWRATDPCSAILLWRERRGDVVRWRLTDEYRDRPEVSLPEVLTPDAYAGLALTEEDLEDLDPRGMPALYRAAYVAERDDPRTEVETVRLDGVTVLDGRPPGAIPNGATWRAELPSELRERPEYRHLFPGRLEGIGPAIAGRLDTVPGVSAYYQSDGLKVYTGATGRTVELVKDRALPRPPRWVEGDNLEQAATEWHRLLDDYERRVREYGVLGDCWRCGGTGSLPARGVESRDRLVDELEQRLAKAAGRSRAAREHARTFAAIAVDLLGPAAE